MNLASLSRPLRIAVLISGGGTTFKNLLTQWRNGKLDVDFRLVVSSNPDARGLEYAREAGVRDVVVERRKCPSSEAFSQQIFQACRAAEVELVVMGGFLKHLPIPPDFELRVMNIHPSLIPAFCGPGYFGSRVHQSVLDFGAKVSGCTVHFVDNEYDHGPVILQRAVPVEENDTAATLAGRVFAAECELYPQAIELFAQGRLRVSGRIVHVADKASRTNEVDG